MWYFDGPIRVLLITHKLESEKLDFLLCLQLCLKYWLFMLISSYTLEVLFKVAVVDAVEAGQFFLVYFFW